MPIEFSCWTVVANCARWTWVPFIREQRPTPGSVMHAACFVDAHGRGQLHGAFARDLWTRVGPLVKKITNVAN